MSVDSADAPPPPPPPPPDYSAADQPMTDDGQAAPDREYSIRADTAAGSGSGAPDGPDGMSPADMPMPDEGQPASDVTKAPDVAEGVPVERVTLPDGRDAIVTGNWKECADNAIGVQGAVDGKDGDCGIVSCANVANEFGNNVSEEQAVKYAVDNKLCDDEGGTNAVDREQILKGLGIDSARTEVNSLEDIARPVENGQGEIIRVNAGELWNDPGAYDEGKYNHAIQVTGVARDVDNGEILGFYVNDSGDEPGKGQFVTAERMEAAAFPRDENGNLIPQQNYANVTIDQWMNINKKG